MIDTFTRHLYISILFLISYPDDYPTGTGRRLDVIATSKWHRNNIVLMFWTGLLTLKMRGEWNWNS